MLNPAMIRVKTATRIFFALLMLGLNFGGGVKSFWVFVLRLRARSGTDIFFRYGERNSEILLESRDFFSRLKSFLSELNIGNFI